MTARTEDIQIIAISEEEIAMLRQASSSLVYMLRLTKNDELNEQANVVARIAERARYTSPQWRLYRDVQPSAEDGGQPSKEKGSSV